MRNRRRFGASGHIALTHKDVGQTVDVIGAQQLMCVPFAHIAVDQQHAFIGLADHRRQVGTDKGFAN
ncbi:hypothetical protein D3C73_1487200 [compost metagenome]